MAYRRSVSRELGFTTGLLAKGSSHQLLAAARNEKDVLETQRAERRADPMHFAGIGTGIMGYQSMITALKVAGAKMPVACYLIPPDLNESTSYTEKIFIPCETTGRYCNGKILMW